MNEQAIYKAIGNHIRTIRTMNGETQLDLANVLGKKKPFISKLENGKAKLDAYTALKINIHYNCDIFAPVRAVFAYDGLSPKAAEALTKINDIIITEITMN